MVYYGRKGKIMERKELEQIADLIITETHNKGLKRKVVDEEYANFYKAQTQNLFYYVQYKNNLMSSLDKRAVETRVNEWKKLYGEYLQILDDELSQERKGDL